MTNKSKNYPSFAERSAVLRQRRNLKMASSAHAYVRGNTLKFYQWLAEANDGRVPEGPPVWICGDCHVGNLGPLADTDGQIDIQIRDLDQSIIGNPAHDLIRLGLSLAMAARGSDLPGVTTAKMIEQLTEGYEEALAERYRCRQEAGMRQGRHAQGRQTNLGSPRRGTTRGHQAYYSPWQIVLAADL
jgi:uncharacterized protein (DUF2252 family)